MTPDDVRELFDRALAARRELDRMARRLEALGSPTISSGIPRAAGGGTSDPTALMGCALVDETDAIRRGAESCSATIAEAQSLIDGTRAGLGTVYGDVLEDRYIRGLSWDAVAIVDGLGRTTVLRYRDVAFDWIATVGPARARAGDGGPITDERLR